MRHGNLSPTRGVRVTFKLGNTAITSAGIASYPKDGATPDDILLAADRACFMVKRDGGGRVATAEEGLALADVFTLQIPTPIDTGS